MNFLTLVLGYKMCNHKTSKELREKQNKFIIDCGSYRTQYLLGMSGWLGMACAVLLVIIKV